MFTIARRTAGDVGPYNAPETDGETVCPRKTAAASHRPTRCAALQSPPPLQRFACKKRKAPVRVLLLCYACVLLTIFAITDALRLFILLRYGIPLPR